MLKFFIFRFDVPNRINAIKGKLFKPVEAAQMINENEENEDNKNMEHAEHEEHKKKKKKQKVGFRDRKVRIYCF